MKGDGRGRLERGGEGIELFDKVSSATAHRMTMTPTRERESARRVKDTVGKKGLQLFTIGRKTGCEQPAFDINGKPLQSSRLPLDALIHFSPSRVGEYKSAD